MQPVAGCYQVGRVSRPSPILTIQVLQGLSLVLVPDGQLDFTRELLGQVPSPTNCSPRLDAETISVALGSETMWMSLDVHSI